ncbi:hypothetical protein R3I94_017813 [Phoxinus phoxinus]
MDHLHACTILLVLFCSPWPSAGTAFWTHLETQCLEDCKPDGGEYKCKTIDKDGRSQAMYCSPQENMDYWGRQCRDDSVCGRHGEDFCWCRINIFSWGYCGLVKDDKIIESGEGTLITSRHRNKRAPEKIDTVDDKVNHLRITFYAEKAPIADGTKWKDEAEDVINRWNNDKLRNKPTSGLITSTHLRIDMQGTFKRNNKLFYNLQIQINKKRNSSESTTVSQILVPDGVPEVHMRRAFRESFYRRAKVTVEISKLQ